MSQGQTQNDTFDSKRSLFDKTHGKNGWFWRF